jgi:hypothetical protein
MAPVSTGLPAVRLLPFMRHLLSTVLARGVPASGIRYEVFGPDLWAD